MMMPLGSNTQLPTLHRVVQHGWQKCRPRRHLMLVVATTSIEAGPTFSCSSSPPPPSTPSLLQSKLPTLVTGQRRLYLIRHGETNWNQQFRIQGGSVGPYDQPLNPTGQYQAEAVRDQLVGLPIRLWISSHLTRAQQTARIVQQAFGHSHSTAERTTKQAPSEGAAAGAATATTLVVMPQFGEMSFGEYEGVPLRGVDAKPDQVAAFNAFRARMATDHHLPWPGGESIEQVRRRSLAGLSEVMKSYPHHDHFCIVAHGRFNRIFLSALLSEPDEDKLVQGNGCINVLDYSHGNDQQASSGECDNGGVPPGLWQARVINFVEHITEELDIPW